MKRLSFLASTAVLAIGVVAVALFASTAASTSFDWPGENELPAEALRGCVGPCGATSTPRAILDDRDADPFGDDVPALGHRRGRGYTEAP